MATDAELLRRYVTENSEAAFRELVTRHLPLVYAAALRQLGGDAHLAQDVAQGVFTALARKARALASHASLAGWLYLGTHHAAAQAVRGNRRRALREQEAHDMHTRLAPETSAADWERVRPVLDVALRELGDADREAVLLRYFEQRPFAEIGAALNLTEDAARRRVDRALDKLHALLARRGVTSTTAALALALQGNAIAALPAGLAASVAGGALAGVAGGAVAGGFFTAMNSNMMMSAIATVAAAVSVGAAFFQLRDRQAAERRLAEVTQRHAAAVTEVRALQAKFDAMTREAEAAAAATPARVVAPKPPPATGSDPRFQVGREFLAAHPEAQPLIDLLLRSLGTTNPRAIALRNLGLGPEELQRVESEVARSTTAVISIGGMSFGVGPESDSADTVNARLAELLGEARFQQLLQQEAALRVKTPVRALASATCDSDLALSPEQATALSAAIDANRRARPGSGKSPVYEVDLSAITKQAADVLSPAQLAAFKRVLVPRDGPAVPVPTIEH